MSRLIVFLFLLSAVLPMAAAFPLRTKYNHNSNTPSPVRVVNPYAYLGKRANSNFNPKLYAYLGKRISPNPYAYLGKRSTPLDAIDDEFFLPEDAYRD